MSRGRLAVVVVALVALVAACGPDRRQIRSAVVGERWHDAEKDLNALYDRHLAEFGKDSPADGPAKHALLWRMERGTVDFLQGEYGRSLDHFRAAARAGRDLRTASASRVAASYLVNDTVRTYVGEPFEHTYVPYYGALASLLLGQQVDGAWARPEHAGIAPPAAPPPETARTWYDRAASAAIALEDALKAADEQDWGESRYRDNAFLHLVAAATRHETASMADDRAAAALYAQRAWKAYAANGGVPACARRLLPRIVAASGDPGGARELAGGAPEPLPDGCGSVLVIEEIGFVPKREQMRIWAVSGAPPGAGAFDLGGVFVWSTSPYQDDFRRNFVAVPAPAGLVRQLSGGAIGVFGFELPILPVSHLGRGNQGRFGASPLDLVDDVRDHAVTCFDDHKAKRVVTALVRTAGKLIATRVAVGAGARATHQSQGMETLLKDVLWGMSSAAVSLTEQADTRCWTLLPDRIAATCLDVPAGEHQLALTRADGAAIALGRVRVRPGRLTIVHVRDFPAGVDHLGPED